MTNENDKNDSPDPSDHAVGSGQSSGGGRKIILTIALLLVLGLFAFDQFISRTAYTTAVEELSDMQSLKLDDSGKIQLDANGVSMKKGDVDGDGVVTDKDVKEVLNREPSATEDIGENGICHTYSWARGIPGKSYNTYVLFTKQDNQNIMYRYTDEKPTEEQFRATTVVPEKGSVPAPSGGGIPAADRSGDTDAADADSDSDNPDDAKAGDGKVGDGEEKADDAKADDAKADDDKKSDDKKSDDEKSDDEKD